MVDEVRISWKILSHNTLISGPNNFIIRLGVGYPAEDTLVLRTEMKNYEVGIGLVHVILENGDWLTLAKEVR